MLTRTALLLAIFGATYAACDARDASATCATAEVAAADATILVVQGRLRESLDPPSKTRALRMVLATALDRKRAALAVCTPTQDAAKVSPFETDYADPFEDDAGDDSELAYAVTVEMVGVEGWATP